MRSRVPDRSLPAVLLTVSLALLLPALASAELVAHWPLEALKGGIVADASGHGHDATASGREGKLPQAGAHGLLFTGADEQWLEAKETTGLAAPAAFTVMAWIRPVAQDGTYEIIGNKGDRSGDPPWPGWRLRYAWTRVSFEYGAADGSETRVDSPEWSVPAGLWSHVAATWDGKTVALFVDGNRVAEQPVTQPILPSPRPLVIGNYSGRKNAYAFDGGMADVRVYDRVLTEDDLFAAAAAAMP